LRIILDCNGYRNALYVPDRRSFISVSRIVRYDGYWLQGKKRIVDGAAGAIESNLEIIHKFMKAARDDVAHLGVIQVGRYPAQLLLRGIAKRSRLRSRNGAKGFLGGVDAIVNRA